MGMTAFNGKLGPTTLISTLTAQGGLPYLLVLSVSPYASGCIGI
jgi:hypothetical protein